MTARRGAVLAAVGLLLTATHVARADDGGPTPNDLDVTIAPVFGDESLTPRAWNEFVVVVKNRGTQSQRGSIALASDEKGARSPFGGGGEGPHATAPFEVAPGATVDLRIPFPTQGYGGVHATVLRADGSERRKLPLSATLGNPASAMLVELGGTSALKANLDRVLVGAGHDPWMQRFAHGGFAGGAAMSSYMAPSGPLPIVVVAPSQRDATTSEPLLPYRAAGYGHAAAVLLRSDALVRLHGPELSALTDWTLAGGTLAVVVVRPEDLRHPTLVALVGGEASATEVAPETLARLASVPVPSPSGGTKAPPTDDVLPDEIKAVLTGYRGGNLHASTVGATASYGLGEVHLLAFDPEARPAIDSPWVWAHVVELLRRAVDRQAAVLFRVGQEGAPAMAVRRVLDPNEGSRWTIAVAVLLLCAYAIVAGPVNFMVWRRRGAPLRSLPTLALASTASFLVVAALASVSKGITGRVRHLTLVEAGAGMPVGAARRWRGFFVPRSRSVAIVPHAPDSVLRTARLDDDEEGRPEELRLERDVLRLEGVGLRPWETRIVEEDGFASLGEGIALARDATGSLVVVNRCPRGLRGLILHEPGKPAAYLDRLESGARASASAFTEWSALVAPTSLGPLVIHDFGIDAVEGDVDARVPGLGGAWRAVRDTLGPPQSWFPEDVPTLLAQLEGGEGEREDSSLRVESDRLLVRVVGYGGAP